MFFNEETQNMVNRFYNIIKSNFTGYIVDSDYSTEKMRITISDSQGSWLMGNHVYEIAFYRTNDGNLDNIKIFSRSDQELYDMYENLSMSKNFLGMRVSDVLNQGSYILVKP